MNIIQQSALFGTILSVYAHTNPLATISIIFISSMIREDLLNMTQELRHYFD
jgi:hypothetical protein